MVRPPVVPPASRRRWNDQADAAECLVAGTPQPPDVDVYLPASYSAGRERYPVVYMHDGQNPSAP